MECSLKLKVNEYISFAQLKRKFKTYLSEQGYSDFKPSVFSQGLIISLIIILEDMVSNCVKNVNKDAITGLYIINPFILKGMMNESDKYDYTLKYLKKYNSNIQYHDSLFFNIKKVLDNLETKHGSKLMIDVETKNMISYILLSLQYEIINMSLKIVKYSNRKTLNNNVLDIVIEQYLNEEIAKKIKLKLDSSNIVADEEGEEDEIKEDEIKEDEEDKIKEDESEVESHSEFEKEEVKKEEIKEIKEDKKIIKENKIETDEDDKKPKKQNAKK